MDDKRYSPGYGDMPLEMQKIFFSQLHLEELKMVLNDNFYMIPEKSVTAFAAVRKIVE
jgi:cobalamin-dependent methionine synthase I